MMAPEHRRLLGILLAVLVTIGLLAYGLVHVGRWLTGGMQVPDSALGIRGLSLSEAPAAVRDAAQLLAASRAAYAMPVGNATYLVISTGAGGERVELTGARRDAAHPSTVNVSLKTSAAGNRLIVAQVKTAVGDARSVRFFLDGLTGRIPALINPDNLPLVDLPATGSLAVVSPDDGVRVMGSVVQVSGYARLYNGHFSVQVFSAGKGRVLGEALSVYATAGAPDWGSFRVNVPVDLPAGTTEGIVLIYDQQTDSKLAVPVRFGSK